MGSINLKYKKNPPSGGLKSPYFAAFTFFASRDFFRATAFLWIIPLRAAVSNFLVATVRRAVASSALPACAAYHRPTWFI